jgi:hypothetical protein
MLGDTILESRNDNTIYCEIIDVGQLLQAARCGERSRNVTMKLAKTQNQQLLKVSMQSSETRHDVAHDVLVKVLSEAEVQEIVAPPVDDDQVLPLVLPPLGEMSAFVERCRSAGCALITFRGKAALSPVNEPPPKSNLLVITSESPEASFAATYAGVERVARVRQANDDADDRASAIESSVTVEARKFYRFFSVKEVNPRKVVVHIVHHKALVLSAFAYAETSVVFYIPAQIV